MHRRLAVASSPRVAGILVVAAGLLSLVACGAPLTVEPTPTATTAPTSTLTRTASPQVTTTPAATATPTAAPSPTPEPVNLTISPATLAQLRPLWSLSEPGNPGAMPGCQDMKCWMPTRIGSFAISPDGATTAIGVCTVDPTENTTNPRHYRYNCDGPAEVRLYDSATGSLLQTLPVGDFPISLAFHPQGKILAAGMAHREVEVWDLETEEEIHTLFHSTTRDGVAALRFSPDGQQLLTYGDSKLQFWTWGQGLQGETLEDVTAFDVSPAGDMVATLFWSSDTSYAELRLHPLDDPTHFRGFRLDWRNAPTRVRFAPDGSQVMAVGYHVEVVDAASGEVVATDDMADLLEAAGLDGYPSLTSRMTGGGRLWVYLSTTQGDAFITGFGLWDPLASKADVWLLPLEGQEAEFGSAAPWDLSDRMFISSDRYLALDNTFGTIWIWGVDPTASPEGVTCLGQCG